MAERKCVKYLFLLFCGSFSKAIRTLMPLVTADEQLGGGLSIMEDGLASLIA
jgi:4-aminobutyrate aminotransferase-like enzyme